MADFQVATTSNLKPKAESGILSKKIYFTGPYHRQQWSLPDSIMHYIAKNPSTSKCYQKMVQNCKYFYIKNPIIIVSFMYEKNDKWQIKLGDESREISNNITSKLWIAKMFVCYNSVKQNFVTSVIPKIYRCDAYRIKLKNQIIAFNDHVFISLAAKRIIYRDIVVKNDDGSDVAFEKLVETLPKMKTITYKHGNSLSNITSATFKELLKIPHFSKLNSLYLENIPEVFDLDAFYGYVKQNKLVQFNLEFHDSISDAYKNRLEEIIDEILSAKKHDYMPPLIHYSGLDEVKCIKLFGIYCLKIYFFNIHPFA
uniref:Uncharacterized protein n=1 Tax=Panagrolaimus sp. ES5 TaxID=591445 RepID=A0AC34FUI9_9BILA